MEPDDVSQIEIAPAQAPAAQTPAASAPEPAAQASPGASGVASATPETTPALGSGTPAAAGGAPAGGPRSFRDIARGFGLDFSHHQDDDAAVRELVARYSQASQQAQQYQYQLAARQQAAQAQAQQQAAAQQAQTQKKHWDPPEYKREWRNLLENDPITGDLRVKSGHDPSILNKTLAYDQYVREFASNLTTNPADTLRPFIAEEARKIAQEVVRGSLGGYQEQVRADQIIQQHSAWLHQKGPDGRPVMNPATGKPALTAEGQLYLHYVHQAEQQLGVRDAARQDEYARAMVQRDVLARHYQGQQQPAAGQAPAAAAAPQAGSPAARAAALRRPNAGGSLQPNTPNGRPPQNRKATLKDRLKAAFAEQGITDANIATN